MLLRDDIRHAGAIADGDSIDGAAKAFGINHATTRRRIAQTGQRVAAHLEQEIAS